MGFTNTDQLYDLFLCGGLGFLLGIYYDGFRLLWLIFPPWRILRFFEDIVFVISSGIAVFLFSLVLTDGILRWYLPVGIVIGFFSYRYTFGKVTVRLAGRCFRHFRRARKWIARKWNACKKLPKFSRQKAQKNEKRS